MVIKTRNMSSIGHMILRSSSRPNPNPIRPGTSSFQSLILFFGKKLGRSTEAGSRSGSGSSWRETWSGREGKIDCCFITAHHPHPLITFPIQKDVKFKLCPPCWIDAYPFYSLIGSLWSVKKMSSTTWYKGCLTFCVVNMRISSCGLV